MTTLPLPVRHGDPAGAAQDDIGQSLASTCRMSMFEVDCTDDWKGGAGGFDDFEGDGPEAVDLHDAVDLSEQPVDRRKLPRMMRPTAAMAWASVKSSRSRVRLRRRQWRVRTKLSSSLASGQY
ncbi:MAG: hypothetical protein JO115_07940 [Pseudonocardiales bacterium]|nr:hypothetical protein [Pseudonocardiales bacterium]